MDVTSAGKFVDGDLNFEAFAFVFPHCLLMLLAQFENRIFDHANLL